MLHILSTEDSSSFPWGVVISVFFIILLLIGMLIISRFIGLYIRPWSAARTSACPNSSACGCGR